MNLGKKSFSLVNRTTKSFVIAVKDFLFTVSFFVRIRFKIPITFVSNAISKFITTINLRKVKLIISKLSLIGQIATTINLRRVRFTFALKQRMKFITTITLRIPMLIVSKAIQKVTTTITLKKIQLLIDMTVATFFTLGTYDPEILGDLDPLTLGDMDYTS